MISGHDPAPTASLSPRSHLIQEFVETEHAYMAALAAMERCFVEVACDSCALAAALFANILELAAFERGFVRKLAAIETRHFEDGVGTLFADNELRFNVYFPFCEAFEAASAVLLANANYLRNYAHILAFHELQSYLIKPVQRLMKYPQLLNELVKHACADGRDTTLLFEGIDAIRRVTSALNETKRETENMRLKQEFLDHLVDYQACGEVACEAAHTHI
ncbi:Dbl homology domain-containing protein [Chytriomyces sp. MP71]|nr:Dbl homology domain-containing protein [Chytriomyces sp. MP71]